MADVQKICQDLELILQKLSNSNKNPKEFPFIGIIKTLHDQHPEVDPRRIYQIAEHYKRLFSESGFYLERTGARNTLVKYCFAVVDGTYDSCKKCKDRVYCLQQPERPKLIRR